MLKFEILLTSLLFWIEQTGISAKAQRKIAREIKTARAFGLMPFTTMGTKAFVFGKTMEDLDDDYVTHRYGDPYVAVDMGDRWVIDTVMRCGLSNLWRSDWANLVLIFQRILINRHRLLVYVLLFVSFIKAKMEWNFIWESVMVLQFQCKFRLGHNMWIQALGVSLCVFNLVAILLILQVLAGCPSFDNSCLQYLFLE